MKLQNNGVAVDVGRNNIFAKGEVREFDEAQGAELLSRYPLISKAQEVKVAKESVIKKTIKRLKK